MIVSFKCRETRKIWEQEFSKKFPVYIQQAALRKLFLIQRARELHDLRAPPANKLEKLKGSRVDQHSIRINNQWRICFVWDSGNARDVEIVDYH